MMPKVLFESFLALAAAAVISVAAEHVGAFETPGSASGKGADSGGGTVGGEPELSVELDHSLASVHGDTDLEAGFQPDPYVVRVRAGGWIEAANADRECDGYVEAAPDFTLYYEPGGYDLFIYVDSRWDTTIVVNDPRSSWRCDDDGGKGKNGLVHYSNPRGGRYDVWVGVYDLDDNGREVDLVISEVEP